jgi:hypothetical protein
MSIQQNSNHHEAHTAYPSVPDHCIRERAYEIYVQRGSKGGHAEGDWLTAEAELRELKNKVADMVSAVGRLAA